MNNNRTTGKKKINNGIHCKRANEYEISFELVYFLIKLLLFIRVMYNIRNVQHTHTYKACLSGQKKNVFFLFISNIVI